MRWVLVSAAVSWAERRVFGDDLEVVALELDAEDLFPQIQDGLEIATPVVVEGMALTQLPFPIAPDDDEWVWRSGFHVGQPELDTKSDAHAKSDAHTGGWMDGQFKEQEATVKVGQSVVVRLPVTHGPKREYLWKLNATYDEDTFLLNREHLEANRFASSASLQFILENSGYVAPRTAEESAYQQLVFKGIQPGIAKLPFLYNRPWYNDLQPGGAATFVTVRVLPRRRAPIHPVTKTSFTVYKGQHLEIKLGNSPTQQYNLWKLMEIFDTRTGHILPGPEKPSLLEFIFSESGYVPPVLPEAAHFNNTEHYSGHRKETPPAKDGQGHAHNDKEKRVANKDAHAKPVADSDRTHTQEPDTQGLDADTPGSKPSPAQKHAEEQPVGQSGGSGRGASPVIRSAGYQKFTVFARAPGRQVLHFAFLKPWLPDDQPDRTTAIIDVVILDRQRPGRHRS
ncbi:hypothetical protein GNI_115260 [Gregarina niphandrodes]|uniref:Uncharacterized protein n=1 Tax=Gregarina niphandrodes TaxID=110365 RepID=A0A023B311_GRENI|nr:hypothetical protein GNI_115260 [Gregarina niphandrodes]EZG55297.1 hypothetical protein GNI_115260 [Gregarina niphandrodes]|eukprot:XP_011131676.1 hypothetical protein GNI_115260 [Gregarina niphandrodes]